MIARKPLAACIALAILSVVLLAPAASYGAFGINSLKATATNKGGSVDLQAGSHPYEYTISFNLNLDAEEEPEGSIRSLIVELPPGLVGNPQATDRCKGTDFDGQFTACPGNTQIGIAHIEVGGETPTFSPGVFNLAPVLGTPFSAGFTLAGNNSFQEASLRTGGDYGANVSDITLPTNVPIKSVSETIWGEPADSGHFGERYCGGGEAGCSTDAPLAPFLTLPTSCGPPMRTTIRVESLQEPGVIQSESTESLGPGGIPAGLTGCEKPEFKPTISVQPETSTAQSPTGLQLSFHIHQNESPEGIATAHLRDTVVSLPKGLVVNPSTADGLGACSAAQIDLNGAGPAQCPVNSKVGTVQIESPLLDHPVHGAVYIAKQGENPFGSLIALYIVAEDPLTGIIVKLAGKVEPDEASGQLKATFLNNPQLPFEDVDVDIFGGARASLTTPSTCGKYTTTTDLTPWSSPAKPDAEPSSDPFPITTSPGGGGCANSEAEMPNKPSFEAGTTTPLAGSYAPFVLKLSRENGSQQLRALNVTLPPGLSAKLAGVQECSEAQIAVAEGRNQLGDGALEKASPSCPAASELGVVNAGAGSGNPFYVQGHAYLAGPYKGAPLSMVIITPAIAGPFDLGDVVVRAGFYVNESTAQVTVKSDPIPTIMHGIPLDVRTIAVQINRNQFTLNPTSCEPKAITGEAISPILAAAPLSEHFQVGGCKGLDFSPKLSLKLVGGTKRAQHPALKAVLTHTEGQANVARLSVALPATEFIDQNHISNPCTRPQFAAGNCPPSSVLGKARIFTPLFDKPLEGPVYFRANGGERELPDIVADLNGQVPFVLVGFVGEIHHKGSEEARIRSTFALVPDAPFSKAVFELNGGKKKGLLVNSQNLCKSTASRRAVVKITAQNAKTDNFNPLVANSCGGKLGKAKRHHRSR